MAEFLNWRLSNLKLPYCKRTGSPLSRVKTVCDWPEPWLQKYALPTNPRPRETNNTNEMKAPSVIQPISCTSVTSRSQGNEDCGFTETGYFHRRKSTAVIHVSIIRYSHFFLRLNIHYGTVFCPRLQPSK